VVINLCTWGSPITPDFLRGQTLFQSGKLDQAIEAFENSVKINPDHLASQYNLGKLYFLGGRPIEAFEHLREALALDPGYEDAASLFEQTLEAIKGLEPTQKTKPRRLSALIYMDLREKNLTQALEKIKSLTEENPDFGFGWDHLANFHYKQKNLDQAMRFVKKALSLNPASPTIFKHYQTVYFLKTHNRLPDPKQLLTKQSSLPSIEKKLLENLGQEKKPVGPLNSSKKANPGSSVKDGDFFQKLLSSEVRKLPPKPKLSPRPAPIKKEEYIPPPEVKKENLLEEKELEDRAKKAFEDRNWEVAAASYAILFGNNPKRVFYKQRFQEARRFDEFERDFRRARRSLARARNDPSLYAKARSEFLALDSSTYLRLHNKASFDEFLSRIAFSENKYAQAVKLCRSWLRQEPENVTALYMLLKSLDTLGLNTEGFEAYQGAGKAQTEALMQMPGISRLVLKLKFLHYWWVLLVFVLLWAAITLGYLTFKVSLRNQKQAKKQRLQSVRELASEGRWLEMVRKIDALLLEELSDAEIYNLQYMKANGLYQAGKLDLAQKQCKSMLARYAKDQQYLVLLGRVMTGLNETGPECLEPYRLLTQKEPKNLKALKICLKTLKEEGIFTEETETLALNILNLENYNEEALKDLVELYLKRKPSDPGSLTVIKRYLDLHGGDTAVMELYIETLGENGDYIEVIRWGQKLLDRNPEIESTHRSLVEAYGQLNMVDEGRSYYHQLSLDYPQSPVIQQWYTRVLDSVGSARPAEGQSIQSGNLAQDAMQAAKALIKERKFKEAQAKLQIASHDPDFKQEAGLLTLKAYLKMQDIPSALFYLNRLNIGNEPLTEDGLEVLYELAEYYLNTDEPKESLKLFRLVAKTQVSFRDTFEKIELLSQGQT